MSRRRIKMLLALLMGIVVLMTYLLLTTTNKDKTMNLHEDAQEKYNNFFLKSRQNRHRQYNAGSAHKQISVRLNTSSIYKHTSYHNIPSPTVHVAQRIPTRLRDQRESVERVHENLQLSVDEKPDLVKDHKRNIVLDKPERTDIEKDTGNVNTLLNTNWTKQRKHKYEINIVPDDLPMKNAPRRNPVLKYSRTVKPKYFVNLTGQFPVPNKVPQVPKENVILVSLGPISKPPSKQVNIISMTLYGSNRRYTMGALRNAELIKENYPGWRLRIYTESPNEAHHGAIPSDIIQSLQNLGAELYFMLPGEDFIPPMMWRFLVADDEWVDHFIVRDADARLTERDAAATHAWLNSGKPVTCVRDHPSHAAYAMSGGMWGGKPTVIRNILRRTWRDMMRGVDSQYLQDMNFLNYVIWPKLQHVAYCVDSVSCDKWPSAYPFPVRRYGYEHVGQVVSEHDLGRPVDMKILHNTPVNRNCTVTSGRLNHTLNSK